MRLLVAASFFALLFSTRPSLCLLEALRWAVCGETMTTPGGSRTPRKACHPRARRTGFSHRVGAPTTPTVRDSDPSSWIETFVTFCGMVGLQAMVLGRLGRKPSLIQERVLYPAHRPPFTGRSSHTSQGTGLRPFVLPFALWGSADSTLPLPLLGGIKAHILCEEIPHLG